MQPRGKALVILALALSACGAPASPATSTPSARRPAARVERAETDEPVPASPGDDDEPAAAQGEPSDEALPREAATPEEVAVDDGAPSAPATPIALACGRADAEVPRDWAVLLDEAQPCINPGYPMDIEAEGIAGGESRHTLRRDGCEVELAVWERAPRPATAPEPASESSPLTSRLPTAEGTTLELEVGVTGPRDRARCEPLAASLLATLRESLRVRALRDETTTTRADVSSAGHGITIELPPGYWLVTTGGAADQWETAYELRGPGEAYASFYTAWTMDEGRGRRFRPRFLPARPRWGQAPDPWQAWSGDVDPESPQAQCQSTLAVGPEPRVETMIYVCGPAAERPPLIRLLRTVRFTRPRR